MMEVWFAARFKAFYLKTISIHRDKMSQLIAMQDDDVPVWLPQLLVATFTRAYDEADG